MNHRSSSSFGVLDRGGSIQLGEAADAFRLWDLLARVTWMRFLSWDLVFGYRDKVPQ